MRCAAWDFGKAVASRAAWYLLAFPTIFFLSAVYAESLFLALSLGAVLSARRGHWLLAGSLGVLAALTRPFVFILAVPLAVEPLLQWRSGARPWRVVAGLLAIPAAFGGYVAYFWQQHGDPLVLGFALFTIAATVAACSCCGRAMRCT